MWTRAAAFDKLRCSVGRQQDTRLEQRQTTSIRRGSSRHHGHQPPGQPSRRLLEQTTTLKVLVHVTDSLSVRPSVCHTHALWLIQRTYRRYFYTTGKGNPSSQMRFSVQLRSSWQDFNRLKLLRGPSVITELLVPQILLWTFYVTHV